MLVTYPFPLLWIVVEIHQLCLDCDSRAIDFDSTKCYHTSMAKVEVTAVAMADFSELPKGMRDRVLAVAQRLANWPEVSGAKALRGEMAGAFRIRTGVYRIVFRPRADRVVIEAIGHRKDVYED
ncbi:MAG: type II toxin-antitoxin system RelE family toxin [Phycisphaerae bacterium]